MEMHGTDDAWIDAEGDRRSREALQNPLNECVKLMYVIEKSREELESLYRKRADIRDKHWGEVMLEIQREKKYGGVVGEEAMEEVSRRDKETLDSNGLTKEIEALEKLVDSYKEARTHLIDDIVKEML